MGCMGGGRCEHEERHQQSAAQAEESKLIEEVARLQQEVETLRGQLQGASQDGGHDAPVMPGSAPRDRKEVKGS